MKLSEQTPQGGDRDEDSSHRGELRTAGCLITAGTLGRVCRFYQVCWDKFCLQKGCVFFA